MTFTVKILSQAHYLVFNACKLGDGVFQYLPDKLWRMNKHW